MLDVTKYRKRIGFLSFMAMARKDQIDDIAYDQADYESELLLKAVESQRKFEARYPALAGTKGEELFVYKSLWNRLRSIQRRRGRHGGVVISSQAAVDHKTDDSDMERTLEAKESIRMLRENLADWQWDLLSAVAVNDHQAGAATAASLGYSRNAVTSARTRARAILAEEPEAG